MVEENSSPTDEENILGLSTKELAGLTIEELTGNSTAIKMVMHYYKQLVDENTSLKNENNTLETYVDGYERKKTYSAIGATILAISNILIGFGVNLLTINTSWPGIVTLGSGIILIVLGLYYSYKDAS